MVYTYVTIALGIISIGNRGVYALEDHTQKQIAESLALTSTENVDNDLSVSNGILLGTTIVLFLILSALSGYEIWTHRYFSTDSPGGRSTLSNDAKATPNKSNLFGTNLSATTGTSLLPEQQTKTLSTGAEMRHQFFWLLFIASTLRALSLLVEVFTLHSLGSLTSSSWCARIMTMFQWLPSLLFVSMYGLMILFWAQLYYACWGKAHISPRRTYFLVNLILYSSFLLFFICISSIQGFWQACGVLLGMVYILGLLGIIYFSVRLVQFFRTQKPDEEFFFDLSSSAASTSTLSPSQRVVRRIMAVCVVLTILFSVKGIYLLWMGIGFIRANPTSSLFHPLGLHHIPFEFSMYCGTEFIPCSLLIFFTRKPRTRSHSQDQLLTNPDEIGRSQSSRSIPNIANNVSVNYTMRSRTNTSQNLEDGATSASGSMYSYQYQPAQRGYGATDIRRGPMPSSSSSYFESENPAPNT